MSEVFKFSYSHGNFSCEIQGSQAFVENNLDALLEKSIKASKEAGVISEAQTVAVTGASSSKSIAFDDTLSTNTIAVKTAVKTGSDLVIAAIARLQLVEGAAKVTRQDVSEEMKTATTFYKGSYTSNLTTYLDTLTKSGRLNLISKDTYSLTASERQSVTDTLGSN